jgi:hypothetical protein
VAPDPLTVRLQTERTDGRTDGLTGEQTNGQTVVVSLERQNDLGANIEFSAE